MTAINSVNFKGDQEQRKSSGYLFPVVAGAVVGGGAGLAIRGTRKPNLEGVSADTFEKAIPLEGLTDDEKSAVKTIKEHLAGNKSSEEKTDAKTDAKDAKDAEAGAKESKTTPKSVASKRELEDIFKGSDELTFDKYLQKKYGVTSIGDLQKRRSQLNPHLENGKIGSKVRTERNIAKSETHNIQRGLNKAQSVITKQQQVELAKLQVEEAQINLQFAEEADKEVMQSELDSAKKSLNKKNENLATAKEEFEKMTVDSEGKTKAGYGEVKSAMDGEITTLFPKGEKPVPNRKLETVIAERLKGAGLLPDGKYDSKKELGLLARDEKARIIEDYKIEKDAMEKAKKDIKKKPEGMTDAKYYEEAKAKAVKANEEMINKRVKLAVDRRIQEIKGKETENFLNRARGIMLEVHARGQVVAGNKLGTTSAKVAEMDADIALAREAKKNNTKITKAQAEESMRKGSDTLREAKGKIKDSIKSAAKETGEKAKAGSESKGVTAGIEDALKTLKDKLPKEFKKWNNKAMLWGAAIGVGVALIGKWMFGGKSEE